MSYCQPTAYTVFLLEADEDSRASANVVSLIVRRQIQHMIKYRYVPFTFGKKNYNKNSS